MILYNDKDVKIHAIKCKRPKMTERRGRTWDFGSIVIGEWVFRAHLDTTWGIYCYFVYPHAVSTEESWYKIKMDSNPFEPEYSIDLFSYPPYEFHKKKIKITGVLRKCT